MVFNKLERFAVRTVSSVFSFLPEQDNAFDSAFSLSDFRFRICFGAFPCKDETFVADPDVSSFAADLHSGGACGNLLCPGMESDDSGVAEHHAPDPLQFSGIQGAECSADRLDRVCMGGLDSLGSLYLLAGNNSAAFDHPFFQYSSDFARVMVLCPRISDDPGEQLRKERSAIRRDGICTENRSRRKRTFHSDPGNCGSGEGYTQEISKVHSARLRHLFLDKCEKQMFSFRAPGQG